MNWFKKAITARPPNRLGWSKRDPARKRRLKAILSRPKNWSLRRKRLSAGRALIALANVTTDRETKRKARKDAKYFFKQLKK